MASGTRVTQKDLELEAAKSAAGGTETTLRQAREQVERDVIQRALKRHAGKITSAAAELGISRPTLYELMEKLGVGKERAMITEN
jgi:two-component system NtrC family response regulator